MGCTRVKNEQDEDESFDLKCGKRRIVQRRKGEVRKQAEHFEALKVLRDPCCASLSFKGLFIDRKPTVQDLVRGKAEAVRDRRGGEGGREVRKGKGFSGME